MDGDEPASGACAAQAEAPPAEGLVAVAAAAGPLSANAGARPRRRVPWRWIAALGVLGVAAAAYALLAAGEDAGPAAKKEPVAEVALAQSRQVALPVEIEARGHVVAVNQIEVRSRIDGIVRTIAFAEGEQVEPGQVLFELDVEDAVAELAHSRAEVARAAAELDDAEANLARSRDLESSGYISSSAIDTLENRRKALRAQLQAARANLRGAESRVERTTIRAPMRARAGMVFVREGGRVRQADAEPMVVLRQFDPIGVDFAIPERQLHVVTAAPDDVSLQVLTDGGVSVEGRLSVVDNAIDPATGTIRLRAELDNPDSALWPGAFVRVVLRIPSAAPVTVLPPQAVIEGPEGHFVYVVDDAGVAAATPVALLRIQQGLAVVDGLEADRHVIVEGARTVRDGDRVRASNRQAPAASTGTRGSAGG